MSVVFAVAWSVLVLATSRSALGRLLAIRVSIAASLAAGAAGIGAGIVVSEALLSPHLRGAAPDIAFAFSSSLVALIAAATLSLLARSRPLNFSIRSAPFEDAWTAPGDTGSYFGSQHATGSVPSRCCIPAVDAPHQRQAERFATRSKTLAASSSSSARSSPPALICSPRPSPKPCRACKMT